MGNEDISPAFDEVLVTISKSDLRSLRERKMLLHRSLLGVSMPTTQTICAEAL